MSLEQSHEWDRPPVWVFPPAEFYERDLRAKQVRDLCLRPLEILRLMRPGVPVSFKNFAALQFELQIHARALQDIGVFRDMQCNGEFYCDSQGHLMRLDAERHYTGQEIRAVEAAEYSAGSLLVLCEYFILFPEVSMMLTRRGENEEELNEISEPHGTEMSFLRPDVTDEERLRFSNWFFVSQHALFLSELLGVELDPKK